VGKGKSSRQVGEAATRWGGNGRSNGADENLRDTDQADGGAARVNEGAPGKGRRRWERPKALSGGGTWGGALVDDPAPRINSEQLEGGGGPHPRPPGGRTEGRRAPFLSFSRHTRGKGGMAKTGLAVGGGKGERDVQTHEKGPIRRPGGARGPDPQAGVFVRVMGKRKGCGRGKRRGGPVRKTPPTIAKDRKGPGPKSGGKSGRRPKNAGVWGTRRGG